eukprot:8998928-Pyramimonas_sp.AAC.1
MEGGSFSKCGSRLSAAHSRLKIVTLFQGFSLLTSQSDDVGMSVCNKHVDSWCSRSRSGILARFRIVKTQQ